jgi:hypothetical protein
MTKREAIQILRDVWGSGGNLSGHGVRRIEAVALPDETALQTVARIAEVDVSGIQPFNHLAILKLAALAEIADAGRSRLP